MFNSGLKDDSQFVTGRDDFGLPIFKKGNGSSETSSSQQPLGKDPGPSGVKNSVEDAKVFEDLPSSPGSNKGTKSWSQVVQKTPTHYNNITFDYVPMPIGAKVVSPLDDVLKKGNEKFKTSKGTKPFSKVAAFAHQNWDSRGLIHISQKDACTFIFKFDTLVNMNAALSKGTWYVVNQPIIVHAWGTKIGQKTNIPLWVKFENVLDNN